MSRRGGQARGPLPTDPSPLPSKFIYLCHKDIVFTNKQRQIIKEWSVLRVNLLDFTCYFRQFFLMDVSSWDLWSAKCRFEFEDKQLQARDRAVATAAAGIPPSIPSASWPRTSHNGLPLSSSAPAPALASRMIPVTKHVLDVSDKLGNNGTPIQSTITSCVGSGDNRSDTSGDTDLAISTTTDDQGHSTGDDHVEAVFDLWAEQEYLPLPSSSQCQPLSNNCNPLPVHKGAKKYQQLQRARLKNIKQFTAHDYRRLTRGGTSTSDHRRRFDTTKHHYKRDLDLQGRDFAKNNDGDDDDDDDDDGRIAQWSKIHGKWIRRAS